MPSTPTPYTRTIILRNLGTKTSTTATSIRLSPYSAGVQIVDSTVPGTWKKTLERPNRVTWRPARQATIPPGDPITGEFALTLKSTQPKLPQYVLIEWLSARHVVLCYRVLNVSLTVEGDLVPSVSLPRGNCRCLSASTEPDSDVDSNPDIDVELSQPVAAGFLKASVPYHIR